MDDLRVPGVLDSPDDLVRLAQAGDEAAFARIVRLHRPDMVRVAFVVTLDERAALEATAAAWPAAWDGISGLADAGLLRPWLCSLAVHEARDAVARRSTLVDPEDPKSAVGMDLVAGAEEIGLARPDASRPSADPGLARALAGLTADDRALLALHVVDPGELARTVGSRPGAAPSRVEGLLRELAAALGEPTADTPAEDRVAQRIRAFSAIPVGHANIDAVARAARFTSRDRRIRLVSIALAVIIAIPFAAVPYLGESGPLPSLFRPHPTASPAPSALPLPARAEPTP